MSRNPNEILRSWIWLQVFFMNYIPRGTRISYWDHCQFFFENSQRYLKFNLQHRWQVGNDISGNWEKWQIVFFIFFKDSIGFRFTFIDISCRQSDIVVICQRWQSTYRGRAVAYTTTLYVMVDKVKGEGRAPTTLIITRRWSWTADPKWWNG